MVWVGLPVLDSGADVGFHDLAGAVIDETRLADRHFPTVAIVTPSRAVTSLLVKPYAPAATSAPKPATTWAAARTTRAAHSLRRTAALSVVLSKTTAYQAQTMN